MMFQFKVGKTLELRDHSMVVSGTWELLVSAVKLIIMDEDRAGQMLAMEELLWDSVSYKACKCKDMVLNFRLFLYNDFSSYN